MCREHTRAGPRAVGRVCPAGAQPVSPIHKTPATCRGGAGPGERGSPSAGSGPPTRAPLCPLQDLKTVLSLPQHPGEFLHPVVYACTAVMLLCLLASVVTYLVHQR